MPQQNSVNSAVVMLLLLTSSALAELPDEPPITSDDREHWSFQPVVRPAVPDVNEANWCRTPVDRFILAKLEEHGLQPMPPADRTTLLRRVTFDLTGLPPTLAQIEAFANDDRPGAYERVVDRLLASPAYGERWGQHWLDLARFAETDGFEFDAVRPNAWRYRDWVITSLNADRPYDEFVRLQLAGDELRPGDPDAAVATGFLLCGPDMPDLNLQQERKHNFLNDLTGTVASVFLGLQMQCATCHDHKFDPISQADFYRLRAFFDPADVFGERAIPTADDRAAQERFERQRAQRWKAIEAELKSLRNDESAGSAERKQELKAELSAIKKADPPPVTMGRVVANSRQPTDPSRLWIRGDFRRPGLVVEPAFVRVVNLTDSQVPVDERTSRHFGERTALADWLVDARHPLTARVMVNRLWQHHFGRGIVGTASDFGIMGDWPTHPELLDWLADEFIRQNWSLKAMHRLLMTSSVYRTAGYGMQDKGDETSHSQLGPRISNRDDELLGRFPRRRLDGEAIRDAMLSAAGVLNREAGGPGVRPPLAAEVTSTLLKNQWPVTDDAGDYYRRSVYLFVRRNLPYPLFAAFDRPDTNQSCPQRNETTTAPQALHLLNSQFALVCAERLAERLRRAHSDDSPAQVDRAYLLTLCRLPSPQERDAAAEFLRSQDVDSLVDFCLALFNLNEFVYVD